MVHISEQVRAAAETVLAAVTGVTTASGSRLVDWSDDELPGVSVWIPQETPEQYASGGSTGIVLKRPMRMIIELVFEVNDFTAADAEAAVWKTRIETAMATTFDNLVNYLLPVDIEVDFATDAEDASRSYYGRVIFEYEAHCYTQEGAPDIRL